VKNSNTAVLTNAREALEARVGYRLAARLSEAADGVDADVAERLRFAREKALAHAKALRAAERRPVLVGAGSAGAVLGENGWWVKVASVLPLLALAWGLFLIQHLHTEEQIDVAAQIDAELLADDLPPSAYNDEGFVEFLKTPRD
jgi:hypothetical protein